MIHAIPITRAWEKGAVFAMSILAAVASGKIGRATLFSACGEEKNLITLFKENASWQEKAHSVSTTALLALSFVVLLYASWTLSNAAIIGVLNLPHVGKSLIAGLTCAFIALGMKVTQ